MGEIEEGNPQADRDIVPFNCAQSLTDCAALEKVPDISEP
jgi:hypothetical protein